MLTVDTEPILFYNLDNYIAIPLLSSLLKARVSGVLEYIEIYFISSTYPLLVCTALNRISRPWIRKSSFGYSTVIKSC